MPVARKKCRVLRIIFSCFQYRIVPFFSWIKIDLSGPHEKKRFVRLQRATTESRKIDWNSFWGFLWLFDLISTDFNSQNLEFYRVFFLLFTRVWLLFKGFVTSYFMSLRAVICFFHQWLISFSFQYSCFIDSTGITAMKRVSYRVLLGFHRFYTVSPSFIWFYWVLLGLTRFYYVNTEFCWVLLGFTRFYYVFFWELGGFTRFYLVLLVFTGFYWVLRRFTKFYQVFTWFY